MRGGLILVGATPSSTQRSSALEVGVSAVDTAHCWPPFPPERVRTGSAACNVQSRAHEDTVRNCEDRRCVRATSWNS